MNRKWLFIHGGWGGPWQWEPMIQIFNGKRIKTEAPLMPGMGSKEDSSINLNDFVETASQIIENEPGKINIAAFSFGGFTATALVGKYSEKINKIVYIDAFVPKPGEAFCDLVGSKISRQIKTYTEVMGESAMIPPFFESDVRYCSHPLHTIYTKVHYDLAVLNNLKPQYIHCSHKDKQWAFTPLLDRVAQNVKNMKWTFNSIKSDHMPMYSHSKELSNLLLQPL